MSHTDTNWLAIAANITREHCRRTEQKAPVQAYTVRVLVVPPLLHMLVFGAAPQWEHRTIYGINLADAKRKAGIE